MRTEAIFSKKSDEWSTPEDARLRLYEEFGLDADPCPLGGPPEALMADWRGRVFVNPPYSDIYRFIEKALIELRAGRVEIAVFLLPSRTGTRWWHELVLPFATGIRFLRGRLKFGGAKTSAPFDSVVVIFARDVIT